MNNYYRWNKYRPSCINCIYCDHNKNNEYCVIARHMNNDGCWIVIDKETYNGG